MPLASQLSARQPAIPLPTCHRRVVWLADKSTHAIQLINPHPAAPTLPQTCHSCVVSLVDKSTRTSVPRSLSRVSTLLSQNTKPCAFSPTPEMRPSSFPLSRSICGEVEQGARVGNLALHGSNGWSSCVGLPTPAEQTHSTLRPAPTRPPTQLTCTRSDDPRLCSTAHSLPEGVGPSVFTCCCSVNSCSLRS